MCWIKIAILCLLVPILNAHKDCVQEIPWEGLKRQLNSLSTSISENCHHHYDKTSLCDPQQTLNTIDLNAKMLDDIMKKAESIYRKDAQSYKFVAVLIHAQSTLSSCVPHSHHANLEPLSTCFNKLETFLENKKAHHQCAWEIVNSKMRVILQRLENRTLRKKRSVRSTATDGGR